MCVCDVPRKKCPNVPNKLNLLQNHYFNRKAHKETFKKHSYKN